MDAEHSLIETVQERTHLAQHVRLIGDEKVMTRMWQADHTGGRHAFERSYTRFQNGDFFGLNGRVSGWITSDEITQVLRNSKDGKRRYIFVYFCRPR